MSLQRGLGSHQRLQGTMALQHGLGSHQRLQGNHVITTWARITSEATRNRGITTWARITSSSSPLIHTRSTIENRKSIQKCPIIEHNIKEITEYNEYK